MLPNYRVVESNGMINHEGSSVLYLCMLIDPKEAITSLTGRAPLSNISFLEVFGRSTNFTYGPKILPRRRQSAVVLNSVMLTTNAATDAFYTIERFKRSRLYNQFF